MDKFVTVDGLKLRYIEEGRGAPTILLHGAALGTSAETWDPVLPRLGRAGLWAIALDQPGFGLSDCPQDYSLAFREKSILKTMDALEIDRAHLIGHSQGSGIAVKLAIEHPERITKVVAVAGGSLLPPLADQGGRAFVGVTGEVGTSDPTLEETRNRLEGQLVNHALITPEALETRHRLSIARNREAHLARQAAEQRRNDSLWPRLGELSVPMMLLVGKQDHGNPAAQANLLRERYPHIEVHVIDGAKHLVQWDAADKFVELVTAFLCQHAASATAG